MHSIPYTTKCAACRSPLSEDINRRLVESSPEVVSAWLDRMGDRFRITGKSLRLHKNRHLTPPEERALQVAARQGRAGDLAELVRNQTFAKVEAGEMAATLSEGLRAQEMLDRRAEKGSDRDLMLRVAGLLSGAVVPTALAYSGRTTYLADPEMVAERGADEAEFRALMDPDHIAIRPIDKDR